MVESRGRRRALPITAFRLSAEEIAAGDAVAARLRITRNELARRAYLERVGLPESAPGESGLTPRESSELRVEYDDPRDG